MKMMTVSKHLFGTLLFAALSLHCIHAEDCAIGEEEAVFTIVPDHDTREETGWVMQCGSSVVWNVPMGYLVEITEEDFPFIQETACISTNATCVFTIEDDYGDGLVEGSGYYLLTYGATTIAVYNGQDGEEFFEKSVCFGPDCPDLDINPPFEIGHDYDDIYFYIRLDEHPEQTSYSIECTGGNVIVEGGGFGPSDANQDIEVETIVEPYDCCTLAIRDAGLDGLTDQLSTFQNDYVVYLDWAGNQVVTIDQNDRRFGYLSVEFGNGCGFEEEPSIGLLHFDDEPSKTAGSQDGDAF